MKTLLAGHDSVEFGWNIASWIPWLRYRKEAYDQIVIVCKEANRYLYEDFATDFEFFSKKGKPDRWLLNGKKIRMPRDYIEKYPEAKVKTPNRKRCNSKNRTYFKYGTADKKLAYDLIIHARACKKYNQEKWNWPDKNYEKVLKNLNPSKVCSIGTEAHHIKGTEDLRGIPLKDLCDIMASSKVLLTPSSGPGHLASLCGLSHIIMTDNTYQKSIKGTNRDRYKVKWNPFKVKCRILDKNSWQPPVDLVTKEVERFL